MKETINRFLTEKEKEAFDQFVFCKEHNFNLEKQKFLDLESAIRNIKFKIDSMFYEQENIILKDISNEIEQFKNKMLSQGFRATVVIEEYTTNVDGATKSNS